VTRDPERYSFSFTAAGMLFHDFMRLAKYVSEEKIDIDNAVPDPNLIMGKYKSATSQRQLNELLKRYRELTPAQRMLIVDLDAAGRKHIALIAICKAYPFIRDFIVEVVREKFLSLDYNLTDGDYQSFYNRKMELHPELETFAKSTTKKARQVVWRILQEAGLIDNTKDRIILPQFVDQRVINTVAADNPSLLKIFLLTEQEIKAQTA
jgi:hypothetical protein